MSYQKSVSADVCIGISSENKRNEHGKIIVEFYHDSIDIMACTEDNGSFDWAIFLNPKQTKELALMLRPYISIRE